LLSRVFPSLSVHSRNYSSDIASIIREWLWYGHGAANENVSAAMAELGIDMSERFPKPFTDEVVEGADVTITMGCGEPCPVIPGKRYEDLSLLHSTGPDIEAARAARDEIREHLGRLAASLGLVVR
jgi:protein-tyrosine-phosphatase